MSTPIDADELRRRLSDEHPPTVLDVRSSWEFRRGRIAGARHAPFWQPWRLRRACDAAAGEVVVTCGHGPRAWMAAGYLRLTGDRSVRLLRGHMSGWLRRGLPLER